MKNINKITLATSISLTLFGLSTVAASADTNIHPIEGTYIGSNDTEQTPVDISNNADSISDNTRINFTANFNDGSPSSHFSWNFPISTNVTYAELFNMAGLNIQDFDLSDYTFTAAPSISNDADRPEREAFIKKTFDSLKTSWSIKFNTIKQQYGQLGYDVQGAKYQDPELILFGGDSFTTKEGLKITKEQGPLYTSDQKIYMNVDFYDKLARFGAKGDWAMAYVVAHEFGHHIQMLLGITQRIMDLQDQLSSSNKITQADYNKQALPYELQADYFTGVFMGALKNKSIDHLTMTDQDFKSVENAASVLGVDKAFGVTAEDAAAGATQHGTSKQRVAWFLHGVKYQDALHSDTYRAMDLNNPDL